MLNLRFEQILKLSYVKIWNAVSHGMSKPLTIETRMDAVVMAVWEAQEAALAQQAQPLTDEMIEAELNKRFEPEEHTARRWTRFGMKNARDLMGQRAQPERELKRHSCALHNTSLPCVRCGDNP